MRDQGGRENRGISLTLARHIPAQRCHHPEFPAVELGFLQKAKALRARAVRASSRSGPVEEDVTIAIPSFPGCRPAGTPLHRDA